MFFNLNYEKYVHTICNKFLFAVHFRNMVHVVLSFYGWLLCHISVQEISVCDIFFLISLLIFFMQYF